MIVPMSGHSTDRMKPLVDEFYDKAKNLYIINISGDANPSVLFPGVKFRLAIFLSDGDDKNKRYFTTRYQKWFAEERNNLFTLISYVETKLKPNGLLTKISSPVHEGVLNKLLKNNSSLGLNSGDFTVYYHNAPVSWLRAHDFVPYFCSERDGQKISTQLKPLNFSKIGQAQSSCGVISSSLFYIWWITTSDCYHLNKREIDNFPIDLSNINLVSSLLPISKELIQDLKKKF
jgi:hypothetical protein